MSACSRHITGHSLQCFYLSPYPPSHRSRQSRRRDLFRRMASGNFALARPVNRRILLSQKPAASSLPSCSPKKNTLTDSQKRWVERLATQTSFGRRTQNALHLTFSRARRYQTAQFYQLDGNTWRKLDSLESNAATFAPLDRSMAREKKKLKLPPEDRGWPIMTSWQVRKWIDSSTALLYAHSEKTFEIKNETESVSASFFFTLKFDAAGKWEMVRTREVPPKGVGGLNAEERKEINRIEKEDRELRSK